MHSLLKREAFHKADVKYEVPANKVPSVYTPVKVDMITKNGSILSANAVDFTASVETITHHLQEYTTLVMGLEKLSNDLHLGKPSNQLITEQPARNTEQYEIYQSIKDDKHSPFILSTLTDLTKIEKQLAQGNYTKFSSFLKKTSQ